jgi:hypothetical protein
VVTRRASLGDTIESIHVQLCSIRNELRQALRENSGLKQQVAGWRSRERKMADIDLATLRRRVAFYCHPDRGGDAELMSRLNALFDVLDGPAEPRIQNTQGAYDDFRDQAVCREPQRSRVQNTPGGRDDFRDQAAYRAAG